MVASYIKCLVTVHGITAYVLPAPVEPERRGRAVIDSVEETL